MAKRKTLGKLKPAHTFFLNPYTETRFTRCPQCRSKTRVRKFPFAIHIDPNAMMMLNANSVYCQSCDLIILHKDKLEELLTAAFIERNPAIIGNDYLIIGTVERAYAHAALKSGSVVAQMLEQLHDFKEVVVFEYLPARWMPDEPPDST
jgi:hypothetical protein